MLIFTLFATKDIRLSPLPGELGLASTFTFRVKNFNSRAHDSKNSEMEAVLLVCRVCAHCFKTGRRHFAHCVLHVAVQERHFTHCILLVAVQERHFALCILHVAVQERQFAHCILHVAVQERPCCSTGETLGTLCPAAYRRDTLAHFIL